MALDEDFKIETENSCCKKLKEKYSKLKDEYLKNTKFKNMLSMRNEAVTYGKILGEQLDKATAEIANLQKACLEEKARADADRAERAKEIDLRVSLETEITNLKSEITLLSQKERFGASEDNEEVMHLRKQLSDGEREINRLVQLLEKEKIKSCLERENAEAEKGKVANAQKALEEEKSRSEERKRLAEIEHRNAEDYKRQLESEKKNKKIENQKYKLDKDKRYAELEKSKKEELIKLTEEKNKIILEEKSYAENLSRKLQESIQKNEELQNRVNVLVSSKKSEANTCPPDNQMIDEIAKLKERLESETFKRNTSEDKLVSKSRKFVKVNRKLEEEECKSIIEKKRADDLSRQLEEDRWTIDELRKEISELVSSRNFVEVPAIMPSTCKNYDLATEKIKLLQKKLKLEKMRVKHANEVAAFEKDRQIVLKHEVSSLKQDFSKFSHRLDFLDKCFSCGIQGTYEMNKTGELSMKHKLNSKRAQTFVELSQMYLQDKDPARPSSHFGLSSGIECKSGSSFDVSDRKFLHSSAISSTSFSDGQLVASQEKAAFSREITKLRNNTSLVAQDTVKTPLNPDVAEIMTDTSKNRTRILDAVESIGCLFSKGKKLHMHIEEKMSSLQKLLSKDPMKEARRMVPNMQGDITFDNGVFKKRKIEKKKTENFDMGSGNANEKATTPASNACMDGLVYSRIHSQETWVDFEKLGNVDCLKLLDLDNAIDEERYKKAREEVLSPALPILEYESGVAFDVAEPRLPIEKDSMVLSCSLDVMNVENVCNNFKVNGSETSNNPLLHMNKGCVDLCENQMSKDNDIHNGAYEKKSCLESNSEYCTVFSEMKDENSISRIYIATRSCIARSDLFSHSTWGVANILHIIVKEDLLPREKVCVFFSLLLYNFKKFVPSASKLSLDTFAGHILSVLSDSNSRVMLSESLPFDEILSLIEDFLINGKILVCTTDLSPEASNNSNIKISIDSVNTILSYKTASHDQLEAGSIILASLCAAVDEMGFICEVSYNIFRTVKLDSSLLLTILHIFAYMCGEKYFTLTSYSLIMMVIKSLVTYLEKEDKSLNIDSLHFMIEDQTQFPCSKCSFCKDAITIDDLIVFLLKKLQDHALSIAIPDKEKLIQKCDDSCSINKLNGEFLCSFIDILSLIELVASKMGLSWSCKRVVPQLLSMLKSCELDDISAAIIILLGQLGRLGVESNNNFEDDGVENIINGLTDVLQSPVNTSFTTQVATVSALLPLMPSLNNLKRVIESNNNNITNRSRASTCEIIKKWFSLLSNEEKSLSLHVMSCINL